MSGSVITAIAAALVLTAFLWKNSQAASVGVLDADDPRLVKVVEDAKATLDLFLTHGMGDDRVPMEDKGLKVRFELPFGQDNAETIWVGQIVKLGQDRFKAVLENDPVHIPGKVFGDLVEFDKSQIVDWSWIGPDNRIYGQYYVRRLKDLQPVPRGAEGFFEALADAPVPAGWRQ
ncbi:MAG: DUF2314 domain-containing protein [Pseudomonadota bacterium]